MEKKKCFYMVGQNVFHSGSEATLENNMEVAQSTKNRVAIDPEIPLLGIYPEKTIIQKDI